MRTRVLLSACLLALGACAMEPTPVPDYTIRIMDSSNGPVAIPPTCPSWVTETTNPFDSDMLPQVGCATARNLAMMVQNPEDLAHGRDMSDSRSINDVGSIRRYDTNQSRGLIWTTSDPNQVSSSTSSATSSSLSGDPYLTSK